ncbi:protein rep [Candidatus Woesearchaeota archaeon]|nr:protein rep [Candidatus Woesearchaeota archaeon]MBI4155074.1 protein rep [Candidatus Woesearchaeota archaeon]
MLNQINSTKERVSVPLVPYRNNNVHLLYLKDAIPDDEYRKIEACGTTFTVLKCDNSNCGQYNFHPIRCKKPGCSICGPKLRRRNFDNYMNILKECKVARSIYDRGLRFVTLTIKNMPTIEEAYKKITYYTWKLERSKWFKDHIFGVIGSTDTTYNNKTKKWHIHRHMIVDSSYIAMKHKEGQDSKFVKLWKRITKGSCYVHVQRIKSLKGALDYVLKDTIKMPREMPKQAYKEYYLFIKYKKITFKAKEFRSIKIIKLKKVTKCMFCNSDVQFKAVINIARYLELIQDRGPPEKIENELLKDQACLIRCYEEKESW